MRLCHQTLPSGCSLFEIVDAKGRIVWSGECRDDAVELLWASGVTIPEPLLQPSGEFDVELAWASPRVVENRSDLLSFLDGIMGRSPGPPVP
jgi:hypothetical protein